MKNSDKTEIAGATVEPAIRLPTCHYSCFISYSRKDEDFVTKLHRRLELRHEPRGDSARDRVDAFLDTTDLRVGENLTEELKAGVEERDKFLVVLSENSMKDSAWVGRELDFARDRELKECRKLLIPIRLVPIEQIGCGPAHFASLTDDLIADFQCWPDEVEFEKSITRLLKSLSFQSNLRRPLSKYIGLEQEIGKFRDELLRQRVFTLYGPGGSGKTRMAIEIAWQLLPKFDDGIWYVELAGLQDEQKVPQEVAAALRIVEQKEVPPLSSLVEHLRDKKVLLYADNCEHVLDSCRSIAKELIAKCHEVTILATSRQPLGLGNIEQLNEVPPLSFPQSTHPASLQAAMQFESIRLFLHRGNLSATENFVLNEDNVRDVWEICHWLEGIPLAIELSAARLRYDPPQKLRESLGKALVDFKADDYDREAHCSLGATIQWSYNLLSEIEQKLIQALAVFEGWHWDTAIEVCSTSNSVMESLRDKSMISMKAPTEIDDENRFYLLKPIQQFAVRELEKNGRLHEMRCLHRDYFRKFVEELAPRLESSDGTALVKLEIERDNLRVAHEWSINNGDNGEALRMGAAFWRFWEIRGDFADGRKTLERLLQLPHDEASARFRSIILSATGLLAYRQGQNANAKRYFDEALEFEKLQWPSDTTRLASCLNDAGLVCGLSGLYDEAIEHYQASRALAVKGGDREKLAPALFNIGNTILWKGRPNELDEALDYLKQSLSLFKSNNDKSGQGWALNSMGVVSYFAKKPGVAISFLEKSLELRSDRRVNHRHGIAETYHAMARVKLGNGNQVAAAADLKESLYRMQQLDSKRGLAEVFDCAILLAEARNEMPLAAELAGASDEIRGEIEVRRAAVYIRPHDDALARVRNSLGNCFEEINLKGQLCELDEMIPNLLDYLTTIIEA